MVMLKIDLDSEYVKRHGQEIRSAILLGSYYL